MAGTKNRLGRGRERLEGVELLSVWDVLLGPQGVMGSSKDPLGF